MLTCDLMLMQDEACRSPEALSMALAAQAYAKSELMWYFRHVAESLPPAPTASTSAGGVNKLVLPLLSSPASGPCISEDGHVVTLISAVTTMYDFLVSVKLSVSNQGGGEIPYGCDRRDACICCRKRNTTAQVHGLACLHEYPTYCMLKQFRMHELLVAKVSSLFNQHAGRTTGSVGRLSASHHAGTA